MMSDGKRLIKTYLNPCIVIALMLLGFVLPAPAPITPLGVSVICIFLGMIWGWSTCGMLWPSILGVIMLGFCGYAETPEAALGLLLTNTTFIASLVGFILFAYINETNLLDVVATWLVTRKFAVGKPWVFMTFLFFALAILAPFIGNPIMMILLGFSFMGPVLKKMGYTKGDALPTFVMLGISMSGLFTVWPFFMPGSIYTRGILSTAMGGAALTGFQYTMCISVPLALALVLFLLTGKFIARIDTKKFKDGSEALLESGAGKKVSLNADQKRGAVILLLFCVAMLIPSVLPASWAFTALFSKAGMVGVCGILTVAILILCKKEDGEPFANFTRLMSNVSWDMVLLTGAIMVIAAALVSEGTGVLAFLSAILVPMVSKMSLLVFVIAVCVLMCAISQFSMNMVLQMVFAPLLAPILVAAGYNPMIAIMAVYFGTQWAYLAPSGSMMAAMVFGNTEWVNKKQLYKVCVPWILLALVMSVIVSLTFPNLFCANLQP